MNWIVLSVCAGAKLNCIVLSDCTGAWIRPSQIELNCIKWLYRCQIELNCIKWLYRCMNKTFSNMERREMGREFLISRLLSFLCTGVIFALFHCFVNFAVLKMFLNIKSNGKTRDSPHNLIILTDMSSCPWDLFAFNPIKIFLRFSLVTSKISNLSFVR